MRPGAKAGQVGTGTGASLLVQKAIFSSSRSRAIGFET